MKTIAELQAAFAQLGKLERRRADKAAKLQAKIAALQAKHEQEAAADNGEIGRLKADIEAYAVKHREELTGGKGKSAAIGTGCIKWRKQPAKVEITGDISAILSALKRRRLTRFIRVKEELDKTALLKETGAIKTPIDGLQIVDGMEKLIIETGA